MSNFNKGFGLAGVVITVLALTILGLTGYIAWDRSNNNSTSNDVQKTNLDNTTKTDTTPNQDSNDGYFLVKEWGIRFKVPETLKDIRYKIKGDTLALFAKPVDLKYDYVKDYDQVDNTGYFSLASGIVYRSTESSKNEAYRDVDGKKLGEYYYYTAWSFSGLATGAACLPLYDMQDQEEQCKENSKAFNLVNQEFIKSIELAK